MKLLSNPTSNPKIAKNLKVGVLTAPLHLAPYDLSGHQVCPMASVGCAASCLNTAGRGQMNAVQAARIRKTKYYFADRGAFMSQLVKEIQALERKAIRDSLSCGVRLNATSDIPWERVPVEGFKNIMLMFPKVQFYDYTKRHNRKNLPKNYHLTFSLAEDNDANAEKALLGGMNVAAVFKGKILPNSFTLGQTVAKVINGDEHDYRPLDPKGVIVGLIAKGRGRHDTTGFVR